MQFKCHGTHVPEGARSIPITFITANGQEKKVPGFAKQTVLEVAHENDINLEGACEGSLACSTCHGIIEKGYEKFPSPSEREEDLLDQAPQLTDRSRLCCQLRLKDDGRHDGVVVRLPNQTRNFYVDGHIPKPH
ncbi:putative adrenodoxin-type ferredoxin [Gregarina niphandrodes]|uniref:Adrenodoxin-type ferredoxin n=1 Tax=Gregarina niphandrodes TaxID=110365 RepID=A0A023B285_GRENI|nr:putative adrenodoxin-type ferredoxin [Gregarina niphandrodes]EZG51587.1 putative adrenodoxin-type ferredoxin [Gregarina niphandrodes]|eukprot:XP_011131947.1 putative adrenodoxin-type ferredoxin [Gregarina niphandrodes]